MERDELRRKINWERLIEAIDETRTSKMLYTKEEAQRFATQLSFVNNQLIEIEKAFRGEFWQIFLWTSEFVKQCEKEDLPEVSRRAIEDIENLTISSGADVGYLSLLKQLLRNRVVVYEENKELLGFSSEGLAARLFEYLTKVRERTGDWEDALQVLAGFLDLAQNPEYMTKVVLPLLIADWIELVLGCYVEKERVGATFREEIDRIVKLFLQMTDLYSSYSPCPPTPDFTDICEAYKIGGELYSPRAQLFDVLNDMLEKGQWHSVDELRYLLERCETQEIAAHLVADLDSMDYFYNHAIESTKESLTKWASVELASQYLEFFQRYCAKLKENSFLSSVKGEMHRISAFYLPCLRSNKELLEQTLRETLREFDFEVGVEARFFASKRRRYAFSRTEIQVVLLELLPIRGGDKILDMFGNIPRISIGATIMGTDVVFGDLAYEYFQDIGTYWRFAKRGLYDQTARNALRAETVETRRKEEFATRWSRVLSELLRGGIREIYPFNSEKVNPYAFFFRTENILVRLAGGKCDPVRYRVHPKKPRFLPFKDSSFDHVIIDPPYGVETRREKFGEKEALPLSIRALQEGHRLVKDGGTILLTLPPVRKEREWEAVRRLKWRKKHFGVATELGLQFVSGYAQDTGIVSRTSELSKDKRVLCVFRKGIPKDVGAYAA